MSPLRIIILAALCYILYRLLFAGKKREKPPSRPVSPGSPAVQDVLVEDPVCHTYVPQKQAIQAAKDGKIYYFCSEKCCQTFLAGKGEQQ
ncbi:MAG: YHS domain-containing protein [Desulfobulbaceae bacterium]|nr:YHS domain-containing protein [Desulfobulbaceae bacterium]